MLSLNRSYGSLAKVSYASPKMQFFKEKIFYARFGRADFLPEEKISYTCLKNNQFFTITEKKKNPNKKLLMVVRKN